MGLRRKWITILIVVFFLICVPYYHILLFSPTSTELYFIVYFTDKVYDYECFAVTQCRVPNLWEPYKSLKILFVLNKGTDHWKASPDLSVLICQSLHSFNQTLIKGLHNSEFASKDREGPSIFVCPFPENVQLIAHPTQASHVSPKEWTPPGRVKLLPQSCRTAEIKGGTRWTRT